MTCDDLPVTNNTEVSYTPLRSLSASLHVGKRYTGTIATYNCLSGYQLVGGSSRRACGDDGEWNGTALSCGKVPGTTIDAICVELLCSSVWQQIIINS